MAGSKGKWVKDPETGEWDFVDDETEETESKEKDYLGKSYSVSTSGQYNFFSKDCKHKSILVNGGLLTGGKSSEDIDKCDILVLLDSSYLPKVLIDSAGYLSAEKARRIIYFPIRDMSIPERAVYPLISVIWRKLNRGYHVHIQCIGGHGRTGLIMALLAGKFLKVKNPVQWVRENYCDEAVETLIQREYIAAFCNTVLENPNGKEKRNGKLGRS